MTADQARHMLRELVRLRDDVQRYQRAMGAAGTVQEVRSSFADQLGRLAYDAHCKYVALEEQIVKLLTNSPDVMSSAGEIDLNATSPRT